MMVKKVSSERETAQQQQSGLGGESINFILIAYICTRRLGEGIPGVCVYCCVVFFLLC